MRYDWWIFNVLNVFMMYEESKGTKSKWHPYIQTLSSASLLSDWPEHVIRATQDNKYIERTLRDKSAIDSSWKQIEAITSEYPNLFDKKYFNFQNVSRYNGLLYSRVFPSLEAMFSYVPYADLANHENVDSFYQVLSKTDVGSRPQYFHTKLEFDSENANEKLSFQRPLPFICNLSHNEDKFFKGRNADEELEYIEQKLKLKTSTIEEAEFMNKIKKSSSYVQIGHSGKNAYEKGSQIYVSYQYHSNAYLLNLYGFTLTHNLYDNAIIDLSIIEERKYDSRAELIVKEVFKEQYDNVEATSVIISDMGIKIYYDKLSTRMHITQSSSI